MMMEIVMFVFIVTMVIMMMKFNFICLFCFILQCYKENRFNFPLQVGILQYLLSFVVQLTETANQVLVLFLCTLLYSKVPSFS